MLKHYVSQTYSSHVFDQLVGWFNYPRSESEIWCSIPSTRLVSICNRKAYCASLCSGHPGVIKSGVPSEMVQRSTVWMASAAFSPVRWDRERVSSNTGEGIMWSLVNIVDSWTINSFTFTFNLEKERERERKKKRVRKREGLWKERAQLPAIYVVCQLIDCLLIDRLIDCETEHHFR